MCECVCVCVCVCMCVCISVILVLFKAPATLETPLGYHLVSLIHNSLHVSNSSRTSLYKYFTTLLLVCGRAFTEITKLFLRCETSCLRYQKTRFIVQCPLYNEACHSCSLLYNYVCHCVGIYIGKYMSAFSCSCTCVFVC